MSILKVRVGSSWVDFCSLSALHVYSGGSWVEFKAGDSVRVGGSWQQVLCTSETPARFVNLTCIGADPQTGGTNRYKFKISTDISIQEDITINFSSSYDGTPSGTLTYSGSITLPAGELEFETGYVITNASPASNEPTINITSSTPTNGSTIHDYATSSDLILVI